MSRILEGPVLVVGGAGKSGRRVTARLDALGVSVRPVSRTTPVPFDWGDPSTWDRALDGIRAAYLSYAPDLAFPGRVVLLSGRGEAGARAAEVALLDAVPSARVVRCSFFTQNFTEGVFAEGVGSGELALPVPTDVPEPFVDLEDVADVAVVALRDEAYAGEVLELTGPESLTFAEACQALSASLGRPVTLRAITAEQFIGDVVAAGEPAELAYGLVELFGEVLDGRNVATTDTVARVLGRPATTLAAAARRDAALLVE